MANIQLIDDPSQLLVSDEEVFPGATVRGWTWLNFAHLMNWLNFHARKVMPYQRWDANVGSVYTGPQEVTAVYPVDLPAYDTRYLTVVIGVTPRIDGGSAVEDIKVKSSTSDPTWYSTGVSLGYSSTAYFVGTELDITYVAVNVPVTGGNNELITIRTENQGAYGSRIDGFGIWEMPPRTGATSVAEDNGGLLANVAQVPSTATGVCDPKEFFALKPIDTSLATAQTALEQAWARNRRIICNIGVADWYGDSHALSLSPMPTYDAYVSVFNGGLYIPAYSYRYGIAKRQIRIAACVKNTNAGTSYFRVQTSEGYYPATPDSWATTDLQWRPWGTSFDPAVDGMLAEVGTSGEWITVELKHLSSDGGAQPKLHQLIIWEDDPL